MEEILKFTTFNKLKSIYRLNSVDNRKESAAEHSWSALLLADFFLSKISQKLDKLKVYEILMFHDVVEIEAGDFPLEPKTSLNNKKEIELESAKKLKRQLPKCQSKKFFSLFLEFEEQKTLEAKFAKAIDVFDAMIHEIDYKEDWKGWSREFLIEKKEKYFLEFPTIKEAFLETLNYFEENGYFD